MVRRAGLTNLVFAYLAVLLVVAFVLFVFFFPFDSAVKILGFIALLFALNVVGSFVVAAIQTKVLAKESVWLQPASERAGTVLVNSVVVLWACGAGFLLFVIFKATPSNAARAGMVLALVAGAGLGRYLQKRYWPGSWAGYAVGLLAALLIILAAAVLIRL